MSGDYRSSFYPVHLALLKVGENFLPLAWWTPISKSPFRFLIAVELENYSFSGGVSREGVVHGRT